MGKNTAALLAHSNGKKHDYLLGSSADTNLSIGSDSFLQGSFPHNQNDVYNYAILNDDVAEESALISSSEGGYDAEDDNDFHGSEGSITNCDPLYDIEESNYGTLSNSCDGSSVISDRSDSDLLHEARQSHFSIVWYRRPSLFMISLVLFLYCFTIGIATTSELQLTLNAVCYRFNDGDISNCGSPEIQKSNASIQKWSNFASAILKILVSAKIGKLSDVYGRRPLIIYTFTLSIISRFFLVFVLNPVIFTPRLYTLGLAIDAFGGSVFMILGLANSYVIDVVDHTQRLQSLGKVTAALFLGMAIGPMFGSSLQMSAMNLLRICVAFMIAALIFIILVLPESRSIELKSKSRRASMRSLRDLEQNPTWIYKLGLSPIAESFHALRLLWISRYNENGSLDMGSRVNVILLVTIDILHTSCQAGAAMSMVLYTMYRFKWDQNTLGIFIGVAFSLRAIVLMVINPWMHKKLTHMLIRDHNQLDFIDLVNVLFALTMELIATLICATSSNSFIFSMSLLFSSFASICSPVLHSSLLKYNPSSNKNGEFFGALALIRNCINLVAPVTFLSIYSLSLNHFPQMIFYFMIFLYLIGLVLTFNLRMGQGVQK